MDPRFSSGDGHGRYIGPIYEAAVGCLAIFDEHLRQSQDPEQTSKTDEEQLCSEVEELRTNFKQWAAYIGAFAVSRASLDARLALQAATRDMVLELLILIRFNMRWVIVQNVLKDEGPDVPGFGAVKAAINRLFVLAVDIRRSARESHQIRPGKWTDQSHPLSTLLRKRYPHAPASLLSQLATSIHTRGASLWYLQHHNNKLASDRNSTEKGLQGTLRASDPAMVNVPMRTLGPSHHIDTVSTTDTTHSAFSQTNYNRYMSRKQRTDSIVSRGYPTGDGTAADEDQYPPIPEGQKKCYICGDPLDSSQSEDDWKKHINQDLEPYLCISEDCLEPPRFFSSSAEWMDHMQLRHTMDWAQRIHTQRWYCHLCVEVDFHTKAALMTHLQAQHHDRLTVSQMEGRIRRNRRIAKREDAFACPICDCIPNSILEREKPYKLLAQHVARHLKSLSFLSISYLDIDFNRDEQGAVHSKTKSVGGSEEGTDASQGSRGAALADEDHWNIPETLIMDNGTRTVIHSPNNDQTVETFEDETPPLDYGQYWHFLRPPNLPTDFAKLSGFAYTKSSDTEDNDRGKRPRLISPKPLSDAKPRVRCPFKAHDPDNPRYENCGTFTDYPRLRAHLLDRKHKPRHQCPVCGEIFTDNIGRDLHTVARTCDPRELERPSWVTEDQAINIRNLTTRGRRNDRSIEEMYHGIYQILFGSESAADRTVSDASQPADAAKVDINPSDRDYDRPSLSWAAGNDGSIGELLLEPGMVDVDLTDNPYYTSPRSWVAEMEQVESSSSWVAEMGQMVPSSEALSAEWQSWPESLTEEAPSTSTGATTLAAPTSAPRSSKASRPFSDIDGQSDREHKYQHITERGSAIPVVENNAKDDALGAVLKQHQETFRNEQIPQPTHGDKGQEQNEDLTSD